MSSKDIDDAFSDFEGKVEDKPKKKFNPFKKKEPEDKSEENFLKNKYKEQQDALKESYEKEKRALAAKKMKQAIKEGKIPHHESFQKERIVYIAIIVILFAYLIIDLAVFHGSSTSIDELEQQLNEDVNQAAASDDSDQETTDSEKTELEEEAEEEEPEEQSESEKEEEPEEEEPAKPKRSGRVDFVLGDVVTEVVDDDFGYITTVKFTIQNDKDTTLNPVVNVFAYDEELKDAWETKSRGTYKYPVGLAPGKWVEGSIDLSPKSFRNLNLEKTIRVELNDTKLGFLKSDSDEISIE